MYKHQIYAKSASGISFQQGSVLSLTVPASNKKQLLHLEEMPDNQLDENFQKQSKDFCSYIYTHAKTKTLKEGITVTGKSEPPLLQHVSL